jgi:hypothetical protein
MPVVAALFDSAEPAEQARIGLLLAGVAPERVRTVARNPRAAYAAVPETGLEVPAGTLSGMAVGSLVGAAIGWLADVLELVSLSAAAEAALTTGLLAGVSERAGTPTAAGLGVGALAGGLLGIHAGGLFMREAARAYAHQVAIGAVMLVVAVPDRVSQASVRAHLRASGARTLRSGM